MPLSTPDSLLDFAWFPGDPPKPFDSRLRELADRAQPEPWELDPNQPLSILRNYTLYTFKRLSQEKKIVYAKDSRGMEVAAYNTGLFSPNYEQIFAFFEKNQSPGRQPWVFKDFLVESDRRLSLFKIRPKAARYFDKPAELIYDPDLELIPNLDHLLDDNVDRYPAALRDNAHQRRLVLQSAALEAGKRAQMNYKIAVPQFYFGHEGAEAGRIQLLLPLCFLSPRAADLALVVQREDEVYRAFTVLPLDIAYKNARLIARPESDWLPSAPMQPPTASAPAMSLQAEQGPARRSRLRRGVGSARAPVVLTSDPVQCPVHWAACCTSPAQRDEVLRRVSALLATAGVEDYLVFFVDHDLSDRAVIHPLLCYLVLGRIAGSLREAIVSSNTLGVAEYGDGEYPGWDVEEAIASKLHVVDGLRLCGVSLP